MNSDMGEIPIITVSTKAIDEKYLAFLWSATMCVSMLGEEAVYHSQKYGGD